MWELFLSGKHPGGDLGTPAAEVQGSGTSHLGGCWICCAPWRPVASGGPPVQLLGESLCHPGSNTRDEHCCLRRTGAFPFLLIFVFVFLPISSMWVFLHSPHPTSFQGGRTSSFGLRPSFWRGSHGTTGFLRGQRQLRGG